MKILITGGTGFVGKRVVKKLLDKKHELYLLTRNPKQKIEGVNLLEWNPASGEPPKNIPSDLDGLINLMGENIGGKRWSQEQKKIIEGSRVQGTHLLNKALEQCLSNNLLFYISASAIGIYPKNTGTPINEESALDNDFLGELCKKWEAEAINFPRAQRKFIPRIGVVFGNGGGMLQKLTPIFKLGLGGPIGNGKMMMSWIHVDDLANIICEAVENEKYQGAVNVVSPNPVTNKVFTKAFASALKRPAFFPVPPFALKLAMGEMASLALDGQEIYPKKLESFGHRFEHANVAGALRNIFS